MKKKLTDRISPIRSKSRWIIVVLVASIVCALIYFVSSSLVALYTGKHMLTDRNQVSGTKKYTTDRTSEVTPLTSPQPSSAPRTSPTATVKLNTTPTLQPLSYGTQVRWGAYAGYLPAHFDEFDTKIGQTGTYLATFVHWGNENAFPEDLATRAKSKKQTLVIYWEAMDYNFSGPLDPRFNYDAIIRGDFDTYIYSFGQSIKNSGVPVILIPFEEMNSDWYPWSVTINDNTAAKHIAAYRRIHDKLGSIPHLQLGWAVNAASVPDTANNTAAVMYPGDEYVDIVGVDGFNFDNPWQDFDSLFSSQLAYLETLNKPIMVFSVACAPGARKPAWITDFGNELRNHPKIVGFIWFNENKERDWRVWSDTDSLSSFRQMIGQLP